MTRPLLALALLLAACGGKSGSIEIVDQLCDGGTETFMAAAQGDGGTIVVQQQCGSPATTTILSAPCVIPEDGGAPVATFTLPANFDPTKGDTITATICSPACVDAGLVCQPTGIQDVTIGSDGTLRLPRGGDIEQVSCYTSQGNACIATEAFLQVIQ